MSGAADFAPRGKTPHARRLMPPSSAPSKAGGEPREANWVERHMMFRPKLLVVVAALVLATTAADPAVAQKQGGVLKVYFFDSPASMSIHKELTIAGQGPAIGVFNNLVMYDQQKPQTGLNSILPDLASEWSWNAGTPSSRSGIAAWREGPPRHSFCA